MTRRIRMTLYRGGTSRGAVLDPADLPAGPAERDAAILRLYGSPDPRQIDGIGGADPLTSKVALVCRSSRPGVHADYLFGQVRIGEASIDWSGNCGNMSSAAILYAVEEGLAPASGVTVFNVNTGKAINAVVTPGDDGSRVSIEFPDPGGSLTGAVLPTGRPRDTLTTPDGDFEVSLIDAANPCVFARLADFGLAGTEHPDAIAAVPGLLARLERLRGAAAVRLKFVETPDEAAARSPTVPKLALVGPPMDGSMDLAARGLSMQVPHRAYPVTVGVATAAAAFITGTVVREACRAGGGVVRIGNPGGVMAVSAEVVPGPRVVRAGVERTARKILEGVALLPG